MVKVICIDDKNKPNRIPKSKWVEEGKEYHIIFIAFCLPQKCQGFSLSEVELNDSCMPYQYYKGSRFGIREEDLAAFLELAKSCTELNDFNLEELIKETEIEVIEK